MQEFMNSLHFGTRFLVIFMVSLFIIQCLFFTSEITSMFTFSPYYIIEKGQVWRILTSAFLHGGILHILMNMLSFTQLGITFESKVGTLSFFFHIIVFSIVQGLIHILIAFVMKIGGDQSAWYGHALGFSGVLFALMIVDISLSGGENRSVLGLLLVPSWVYPWIMLFLMSLLIQNASFLGHLSGMVAGYLYQFKILKFITPPTSLFAKIERKCCCCCLNRLGYIAAEGVSGYRPWAVFQHTFHDSTNDEERHYGFQGNGRTIGDVMQNPQNNNNLSSQNSNNNQNLEVSDNADKELESLDIHLEDFKDNNNDDNNQNNV